MKYLRIDSLFTKLLIRFLVISLLIIIILGLSMIYFFEDFYYAKKREEILENSRVVTENLSQAITRGDKNSARQWLQLVAEINTGQAWLINEEGYLILSHPSLNLEHQKIKFLNQEKIFSGNVVSRSVDSSHFEQPMLLVGLPVASSSGINGGLLIFTSVEGIESTIKHVQKLMIYSSIVAILLAMILAYSWSRSLSKPLRIMSGVALDLSQGNFGDTIDTDSFKSSKEIETLANSINYMSRKLNDTIDNLIQERNKLKYVVTGMEEGVIALNNEQELILINDSACQLLELDDDSLLGRDFQDVIQTPEVIEIIEKTLEQHEIKQMELTLKVRGQEKRVLTHFSPIFVEEERFWGAVGLFQDISDRWRFEQLQQEFVANVSHELKAPLSSIKGSTEILLDGVVSDSQKEKEYLKMIMEESDRLTNLVEEILVLARYDSGMLEIPEQQLEVSEFLKEVARVFVRSIDNDERLGLDLPDTEIYLRADREKLKQVLLNLLDNARKFSQPDQPIKMGADPEEDRVKFWVKDRGIGVPPEELENIWERFYKVDKARTPGRSSSGLGLSIVRQIVEAHGGEVFARSTPGQGSTFGFYLPLS